jgi:hypothetical protein
MISVNYLLQKPKFRLICEIRKASSLVANNVLIVATVFVPPAIAIFIPLLLFPFVELINCCPLLFELFSFIFDETGNEIVDVSDVTVVVRIVERDDANVVTIRPCRMKSL